MSHLILIAITLAVTSAWAGVLEIKELSQECQSTSTDKRCLEYVSAKTIRAEVESATLLNEAAYLTAGKEEKRLGPVLRVAYKGPKGAGIILFSKDASAKMGVSLADLQDKLTDSRTLVSVRQIEESGYEGYLLAIQKLSTLKTP